MIFRNILPLSVTSPVSMEHTVAGLNLELHIFTFETNFIILEDISSGYGMEGVSFKEDLILGVWGESLLSFDTELKHTMLRYSLGADYSFAKYFYIAVEYFYDESGEKNSIHYIKLINLR